MAGNAFAEARIGDETLITGAVVTVATWFGQKRGVNLFIPVVLLFDQRRRDGQYFDEIDNRVFM